MNQTKYRTKNKQKRKNKSTGALKAAALIVTALIAAGIAVTVLRGGKGQRAEASTGGVGKPESPGIVYDSGAVVGGWEGTDAEELVASLNEKVEEGMINISMNTAPTFENGTAEGALMIVNEAVNRYPQIVEIVRADTKERIYRSGAIPVGSKIEQAKLAVDLDAGTYDCTALFYSVDPETGNPLGCAGAAIRITVLS